MLKSLFVLNGWRQKDVAHRLSMAENSVGRILKPLPVTRRTAAQVSDLVDKPVDELFQDHAPKEVAVTA